MLFTITLNELKLHFMQKKESPYWKLLVVVM